MNTDIIIRDLEPEDAFELSALFRRSYGESYGSPAFYDITSLVELISKRELISAVATRGQQIIGHTGITVHHLKSKVCEAGNTVVDPNARGQGLLLRLGAALHELVQRKGYVAYLHYPTTAHEIMQRASVAYGGKETGVMLAYVPETTIYNLEDKQLARLAATVAYQALSSPPSRELILPERYYTVITSIYENLNLDRQMIKPVLPLDQSLVNDEAQLIKNYNPQRELLHIFVATEGRHIASKVSALIEKHQPKITHIDLPLDNSEIDFVIESLIDLGFFFSALLPEFAHTDLLRLQAISALTPSDFELNLINEDAINLANFIRSDAGF